MDTSNETSTLIDAATVVIGRNSATGIEVLILKKNSAVSFGGMWVFPGDRVDTVDRNPEDADPIMAFRRAAHCNRFGLGRASVRVGLADCKS